MDCIGTYLTHVQICDNIRLQSATQWTASVRTWHMSKPVTTFVFKVLRNGLILYVLDTCPNLWQRSSSKCYAMDWSGTYTSHMSKPMITFVFKRLRHRQCDNVRVQKATQSTASAHTWHMSKPVTTFVFKVLWNGLLRYILDTCPNLW